MTFHLPNRPSAYIGNRRNELVDGLCGVVLTHLSSMPARCAPRGDLATRRNIERAVFEVRTEMAKVCQEMADKAGEPPLRKQG